MTRAFSLPGAFLSLVLWTMLTVGGGIAQAGGESQLSELAEQGIVYAIPAAALLLILLYRSKLESRRSVRSCCRVWWSRSCSSSPSSTVSRRHRCS
jgi:hypothetical protein